jgi:hypothetical protein
MLKTILVATVVMSSVHTHANFFSRILGDPLANIFTSSHGEGVPKKVGEKRAGAQYRAQFIKEMGITSYTDSLGLTQYQGNDVGIALIKRNNTDEAAFITVLNQKDYTERLTWRNGPGFIEALKEYTARNGCIPKVTSVSHGWRSTDRPGEGKGLSGSKGQNGIYATQADLPEAVRKLGSRSLSKDMQEGINSGEIKFCSSCVAQFYACNIAAKFADTFSKVSGCQTVVATGLNSPMFQSLETSADKQKVYAGAHYWQSAAGVWAERYTDAHKARGERPASWYRSTPLKDANGNVKSIVGENLGQQYISL